MSTSPTPSASKTSPEGTTTVSPRPILERIDDGLSDVDADAEDDQNLYSSQAPLLSNRTRDPTEEPNRTNNKWFHKISRSWKAATTSFRTSPASWTAPKKHYNWRNITLFTILTALLGTIL